MKYLSSKIDPPIAVVSAPVAAIIANQPFIRQSFIRPYMRPKHRIIPESKFWKGAMKGELHQYYVADPFPQVLDAYHKIELNVPKIYSTGANTDKYPTFSNIEKAPNMPDVNIKHHIICSGRSNEFYNYIKQDIITKRYFIVYSHGELSPHLTQVANNNIMIYAGTPGDITLTSADSSFHTLFKQSKIEETMDIIFGKKNFGPSSLLNYVTAFFPYEIQNNKFLSYDAQEALGVTDPFGLYEINVSTDTMTRITELKAFNEAPEDVDQLFIDGIYSNDLVDKINKISPSCLNVFLFVSCSNIPKKTSPGTVSLISTVCNPGSHCRQNAIPVSGESMLVSLSRRQILLAPEKNDFPSDLISQIKFKYIYDNNTNAKLSMPNNFNACMNIFVIITRNITIPSDRYFVAYELFSVKDVKWMKQVEDLKIVVNRINKVFCNQIIHSWIFKEDGKLSDAETNFGPCP